MTELLGLNALHDQQGIGANGKGEMKKVSKGATALLVDIDVGDFQ